MPPQLRSLWFSCLAIGAIVAASHAGAAQQTTPKIVPELTPQPTTQLKLVSTPWSPFTNPPGQPRFALDLVEAALGRSGVTTTITIVEPARFTSSMLSSDYDGSAAAWKDDEREKVLVFSQPYLENRLVLIGRKGADVSAPTLAALVGRQVAIVEGYAYGDIDKAGPVFVRTHSEEDSLSQLLQGAVEYVLMDELAVQYISSNYAKEAQARLAIGATPLLIRPLYLAVRRTLPDAEGIISRFNAQLRNMIVDRTYHRLLHVAWIEADIDGDGVPEYVPATDEAGQTPPTNAYSLFTEKKSPQEPIVPAMNQPGFYVGGTIYPDWASIPFNYKIPPSPVKGEDYDPGRNTASLFKFVWK